MIECADGQLVALDGLMTAAPCVEFSRFAHLSAEPLTSDQLRTTLQFLDGGMRGFYARLADGQRGAVDSGRRSGICELKPKGTRSWTRLSARCPRCCHWSKT